MKRLKFCAICLLIMALALPTGALATEPEPSESGNIEIPVRYMDTLPGNWSPLSELTPEKEFLLNLTAEPLFRVLADGSLTSSLAAAPVDVTAEYAGVPAYGIPEDALRGYAFRIDLNENACWEDGTSITADDYLFSMEQYWNSGKSYVNLANADAIRSGEAPLTETVVSLEDAGFSSLAEAQNAGYTDFFLDVSHFWGLDAGWKSIEDRTRLRDYAMPSGLNEVFVTPAYLYKTYLADGQKYDYWQGEFIGICTEAGEPLTYEALGLLKTGDHQITLILAEPTTATALALDLADFRLVRQSLWGDTYGTSASRYSSYGPYRIESADTELIVLVENENWYGGKDPEAPALIRCKGMA